MKVSNAGIGLALIMFAGWVFYYTQSFPTLANGYPGPALFPRVLATLFLATGIVLVIQSIYRREKIRMLDTGTLTRTGMVNILIILVAIVFYMFFSEDFGFLLISPLLLFFLMKWFKVKTILSAGVSLVITLAIYLLFAKVLLVPLPRGLLGI